MEIIFATKNAGKLKEIKDALEQPDNAFYVISAQETGISADVVEDGDTYEANAIKKAETICRLSNRLTLADDSGIEIDCLDKQPGVYSARYLGKHTPYTEKNRIILDKLTNVPDALRTARYVCVIAAAFPGGGLHTERGVIEGLIAREISSGINGFGYDPIFFLPEYGKAMSDIPMELKNRISHRGLALGKMKAYLYWRTLKFANS